MTSRCCPLIPHRGPAWSLVVLSFIALTAADAQARQADLSIAQTVNTATPNVGDTVTFTVVVTNNGPATATGVNAVDLLPGGLSFISAAPSQGTYTTATGLWSIGTLPLPPSAAAVLTITATVVSPGSSTNTVTVTSAQTDPDPANNVASVTVTPQMADLSLAKTVNAATPNVGDTVTFTITLTNSGPSAATGVSVTDVLPAGLTFVSATVGQGSYSSVSGDWVVGSIASGASATLALRGLVVTSAARTNTATISRADQFDPNNANNSASSTVTPQRSDLSVTKGVNNATPRANEVVTFTITLTNSGPSTATGVIVGDVLPAGLTLVSSVASQGSYSLSTGEWTVGSMAQGTPVTLQINARVESSPPKTNTASIAHADQFDPNPANNSSSSTVTPQLANLVVSKTVNVPGPNVGDVVTFTITLTNNGPDAATNVLATDALPAGLQFVSATPSVGSYSSATGRWSVGTMTPGTPRTLQIQARVAGSAPSTNTVVVAGDQFDPAPANNTASVTVTPLIADLGVTTIVSNAMPSVGGSVTFTTTLTNNGPSSATAVTGTDVLPAGLTFVSAAPSQGTYNPASGLWTVGTMLNGASVTLAIQATVAAPSPRTNTFTITHSDQFDPVTANNSASITVTPTADLAVTKTVNNASPLVGATVSFTITLRNNGPSTATNVAGTDLLPAGLSFVSASPSQGSYASVTGAWAVGTMASGATATLVVHAGVTAAGPKTNTVTVAASETDPALGNNTASATVTQVADLAVTKTVNTASVIVGETVTFTITVANRGPMPATGITATDLLPAGLAFVSATPSQGSYAAGGGAWTVGALANGASATLALQVRATTAGAKTNTVTVSGVETDPAPANNSASASLTATLPLPVAADDSYATGFETTLTVPAPGVLGNDNAKGVSGSTAVLDANVASGSLSLAADGAFTFTPAAGSVDPVTFTYHITNAAGASNVATATIAVAEPTSPQPPKDLYTSSIAGNLVTLRWTAPTIGPAATDYRLEGGINPGEVLASIPTGNSAPIFTFVAPSGAFYVRVHTVAGVDKSAASNEIRLFVNVPAAPSAPAGLAGDVNGSGVELSWRNTFGGAAPAGLLLDVSGSLNGTIPLGPVDTVSVPVAPGGTYTLSLRAANASGLSPSSNAITLTVPAPCPGPPSPPANFLAYKVGSTIGVVWEPAASGPATTGYVLQVSGSFSLAIPTGVRALSGAVPPGTYTLSVAATNSCGVSTPTSGQTVVVP